MKHLQVFNYNRSALKRSHSVDSARLYSFLSQNPIICSYLYVIILCSAIALLKAVLEAFPRHFNRFVHFNTLETLGVRIIRCQPFCEFFETESSVSIEVQTPDDANTFAVRGDVGMFSKERFQVFAVDIPVAPIVYVLECKVHLERFAACDPLLEFFNYPIVSDFLFEKRGEFFFNLGVQSGIYATGMQTSLAKLSSQVRVITGHNYLQEVLVLQEFSLTISRKVLDDVCCVSLSRFINIIGAKVVQNFFGGNSFIIVPVNALKHGMWLKLL